MWWEIKRLTFPTQGTVITPYTTGELRRSFLCRLSYLTGKQILRNKLMKSKVKGLGVQLLASEVGLYSTNLVTPNCMFVVCVTNMSEAQPTTYGGYLIGQRLILKDVKSCGDLTWYSILILDLKDWGKPQKSLWRLPLFGPQYEIVTSNIESQKCYYTHRWIRVLLWHCGSLDLRRCGSLQDQKKISRELHFVRRLKKIVIHIPQLWLYKKILCFPGDFLSGRHSQGVQNPFLNWFPIGKQRLTVRLFQLQVQIQSATQTFLDNCYKTQITSYMDIIDFYSSKYISPWSIHLFVRSFSFFMPSRKAGV
jgi:hypothetical protein